MTEKERLLATEPESKTAPCDNCGVEKLVYRTEGVKDYTAPKLELIYECGTCQHRAARRINASDGRVRRRGY